MAVIFCMFLTAYPPMMATLCCGWGRCACYVGHHKIWWGYGCTTPPCLHWYTTVVTWRCWNSSKWWHIMLCTFFLCRGRTFSCNPSSFIFFFAGTRGPSSNQSSFPSRKSLNFRSDRGKFTLAILKPPHSSPLLYFSWFKSYGSPE
jgi:hypothetical protein